MPGAFANGMIASLASYRWPDQIVTLMLHYNTMNQNVHDGAEDLTYLLVTNLPTLPSCHSDAQRFMNIVTNANYDEANTPPNLSHGAAAAIEVANAQAAVVNNDQALWGMYGLHSFVILTGQDPQVEIFEAWAGGGGGYSFYQSVINEPDSLGVPRVHNARPTRANAAIALGELISGNVATRLHGVNTLSRAGHPGFGGHTDGSPVPGIQIRIVPMVDRAAFGNRFLDRCRWVGYWVAASMQLHGGNNLVCSHCFASQPLAAARAAAWVQCTVCGARRFCANCKLRTPLVAAPPAVVVNPAGGGFTFAVPCDCNQPVAYV